MPTASPDAPTITLRSRLTLAQAARLVGKSPSCIYRWWRDGVRGVHLECHRYGRSLFTSERALEAFAASVSSAATPTAEPNRGITDAADSASVAGL